MNAITPYFFRLITIGALTLLLDQASKWLVLGAMNPPVSIPILPFFNLVLVWNHGISFGMFQFAHDIMPYIWIGVAVLIVGFVIRAFRGSAAMLDHYACGLIVGGAVGNALDRLNYGAVVDFLDFHYAGWHWPAFNIADAGVVVGVLLLLAGSFRTKS